MSIRKYYSNADTTITNAYKSNLKTRATGSNMGESDILETFYIYAQASSTSTEQSRVLIKFPTADIATDRTNKIVPASGSVNFYLRLYNAEHPFTLPTNFDIQVSPITTAWEEGHGLDMEEYSDMGVTPATAGTGTITIDSVDSLVGDKITIITPNNTIVATGVASGTSGVGENAIDFQVLTGGFNPPGQTAYELATALDAHADLEVDASGAEITITVVAGESRVTYSDVDVSGDEVTIDFTDGTNPPSVDGATWNAASSQSDWTTDGGDYSTATLAHVITASFTDGDEDIEIDVTTLVEGWIATTTPDHGFMIRLNNPYETGTNSFYTKKFFGKGTEFFYKQPTIEARWDGSEADDRANFYAQSNLRSITNNQNVISVKNYVDGALTNIPSIATAMTVKFYTSSAKTTEITPASLTMDNTATGIYKATVVISTALSSIYAEWQDATPTVYHTETITVKQRVVNSAGAPTYVTAVQNLKKVYSKTEIARFRLFIRLKDWSPTIYTVATKTLQTEVVEKAYYKVVRVTDELTVIDYGSDTIEYTKLSYDEQGCFFDLDMSLLEEGWAYRIEFMYKINGETRQQPETFKFRVE